MRFFLLLFFLARPALANICGTDYQNFNPTSSGLDFVTVHSSETLRPCIINLGAFMNYAANSLTYSKTLTTYVNGQRRSDRSLGLDLSIGMGLTERWDIGFSMPIVLSQSVQDNSYVSSLDKAGVMEVRVGTKYRFLGDERGGLAGMFSINRNTLEDNPFAGRDPGPTFNFDLIADTVLDSNWAIGINAGYRKRNPGTPVPGVPFVPMGNQYTMSVAGSYYHPQWDSKLILELYASRAAQPVDQDTDRGLNALEALAGIKYDYSQNLALHAGMTKQVDASIGGAEWRVYSGLNWAFGPVCAEKPVIVASNAEPILVAVASESPKERVLETLKLDVDVLFAFGSDKLEPQFVDALQAHIKNIKSAPFDKIVIEGHTDSVGAEVFNMQLSENRAKAVREALVKSFNINAEKLESKGYGPTRPIGDNGNYQGRRKNRRVELKVIRSN